MKWGKLGGLALFCIAFSLIAPAMASAAINIAVDYPVGGEQVDYTYLDVNWTTSEKIRLCEHQNN